MLKSDGWPGVSNGRTVPNTKAATKAETVKNVDAAAKKGSQPLSVRIHKREGMIQDERTSPVG